jgi:hypothetical protein
MFGFPLCERRKRDPEVSTALGHLRLLDGLVTISAEGTVQVKARVPLDVVAALDDLAETTGVSRSDLIRQGVKMVVNPAYLAAVVAMQLADVGDHSPDPINPASAVAA